MNDESILKPAADWLKCFNWNGQTEDQILHQIEAVQRDALLEAAEIVNTLSRGTKSEDRAIAIDEARDAILERSKTLTPHFHSTSGGRISDLELQIELVKMLPEVLFTENNGYDFFWFCKGYKEKVINPVQLVRPTEWLHVCWLIRVKHMMPLHVGSQEPWQEQAEHIFNYAR